LQSTLATMSETLFKSAIYKKIRECKRCHIRPGPSADAIILHVCEHHRPDHIDLKFPVCDLCGEEIEGRPKRDIDNTTYHKLCFKYGEPKQNESDDHE